MRGKVLVEWRGAGAVGQESEYGVGPQCVRMCACVRVYVYSCLPVGLGASSTAACCAAGDIIPLQPVTVDEPGAG